MSAGNMAEVTLRSIGTASASLAQKQSAAQSKLDKFFAPEWFWIFLVLAWSFQLSEPGSPQFSDYVAAAVIVLLFLSLQFHLPKFATNVSIWLGAFVAYIVLCNG